MKSIYPFNIFNVLQYYYSVVDLPEGWEEKETDNGRVYYLDHVNKRTQWERPALDLPEGWEEKETDNGQVYYLDHLNMKTQWERPASSKFFL